MATIKKGTPLASKGDLDDSASGNEPLWRVQSQSEWYHSSTAHYLNHNVSPHTGSRSPWTSWWSMRRRSPLQAVRARAACARSPRARWQKWPVHPPIGEWRCLLLSAVPSARISTGLGAQNQFCPTGQELGVRRHRVAREDQDRLGGQRALRGREPAARRAHGPHQAQDPLRSHRVAARGGE